MIMCASFTQPYTTFVKPKELNLALHDCFVFQYKHAIFSVIQSNVTRFSAQQRSESQAKRKVGNQVIRKGWLGLNNVGMFKNKEFWFVLTSEAIMWFKDEEVSHSQNTFD